MSARQPEITRERILQSTFQAVYRQGLAATALDGVLERCGVTKGALYHHFDGKCSLAVAVVDEVVAPRVHAQWTAPLEATADPLTAIQAALRETLEGPSSEEVLRFGCPLGNLMQEAPSMAEPLRRRVDEVLHGWIEALRRALVRGQAAGSVRGELDAERAARFLVGAIEGALGLGKATQDRAVLRGAIEELSGYLESLRPAGRRPARRRRSRRG